MHLVQFFEPKLRKKKEMNVRQKQEKAEREVALAATPQGAQEMEAPVGPSA